MFLSITQLQLYQDIGMKRRMTRNAKTLEATAADTIKHDAHLVPGVISDILFKNNGVQPRREYHMISTYQKSYISPYPAPAEANVTTVAFVKTHSISTDGNQP